MNRRALVLTRFGYFVLGALVAAPASFAQSTAPADYVPFRYHMDGYIYIRGTESWLDDSTGVMGGAVGSAVLVHRHPERHETDWILVEGRGLALYPPGEEPLVVLTTPGQYVTTKLGGVRTPAADYDRSKLNGALELLHRSTINTKRPMLHAPFVVGLSYGAANRFSSLVAATVTPPSGTANDKLVLTQTPVGGVILTKPGTGMTNQISVTVSTDAVADPAGDTQTTAIEISTTTQNDVLKKDAITPEFQSDVTLVADGVTRADLYYKFVFTNAGRLTSRAIEHCIPANVEKPHSARRSPGHGSAERTGIARVCASASSALRLDGPCPAPRQLGRSSFEKISRNRGCY